MAKTAISEWASAAGDNTDVAGINIDEGMAPSDVNNAMRAMMAQLRNWYDQEHVGQVRWFGYDGPDGNWLECDGAAYDSVTDTQYAALYARIGTTFGGSGATVFRVPDLRGRSPMGAGQGDTAEGGGTGTSRALGDAVGQETDTIAGHTHTGPSHTHSFSGNTGTFSGDNVSREGGAQNVPGPGHVHPFSGTTAAGGTGNTGSGGGHAVDTVSPGLVLKAYIGF